LKKFLKRKDPKQFAANIYLNPSRSKILLETACLFLYGKTSASACLIERQDCTAHDPLFFHNNNESKAVEERIAIDNGDETLEGRYRK
jgi:hypothetical protein